METITTKTPTKSKYFTSLDYYDKRDAKVTLSQALAAAGWKIYGFKEDRSNSMEDYFDPAYWQGIATKNGFTLCVDVYSLENSGREIFEIKQEKEHCPACNGTGEQPNGWTLQQARSNPKEYNLYKLLQQYPGGKVISDTEIKTKDGSKASFLSFSGHHIVSPIPFNSNGNEKCRKCHGTKEVVINETKTVIDKWPTYQLNPKRKAWHLEKEGKILASGMSIAKLHRSYYEGSPTERDQFAEDAAKNLVLEIEAFMTTDPGSKTPKSKSNKEINSLSTKGIELIKYNEKCFALKGETKPYASKLGRDGLGGLFNTRLTDPASGQKFAGWIFSNSKLEQVQDFIQNL